MARNRMRSSGRHSNETTKSNERKDEEMLRKKRCAYGRVKKREREEGEGRNVEMQTDGVLRSSLVSRLRKLPEELPEALQPGRA